MKTIFAVLLLSAAAAETQPASNSCYEYYLKARQLLNSGKKAQALALLHNFSGEAFLQETKNH